MSETILICVERTEGNKRIYTGARISSDSSPEEIRRVVEKLRAELDLGKIRAAPFKAI